MKTERHISMKWNCRKLLAVLATVLLLAGEVCGCDAGKSNKPLIGIAWRADTTSASYLNTVMSIEMAGGMPVLLDQVLSEDLSYNEKNLPVGCTDAVGALSQDTAQQLKVNTWKHSNAKAVMEEISAVVFSGGEDISPSLFREPQEWHGIFEEINYNAARDVSDYLLMTYCLDNDIPTLGICRGMQMMAVAAGADMIQDIPSYFSAQNKEYSHLHRYVPGTPEGKRDYVPHNVEVVAGSMAHEIAGMEILTGCPSLHHQAVLNTQNTGFAVTGTTQVSGEAMIEIIEDTGKSFMLGLQFHPETAVGKSVNGEENADFFMSSETALTFFRSLVEAADRQG